MVINKIIIIIPSKLVITKIVGTKLTTLWLQIQSTYIYTTIAICFSCQLLYFRFFFIITMAESRGK